MAVQRTFRYRIPAETASSPSVIISRRISGDTKYERIKRITLRPVSMTSVVLTPSRMRFALPAPRFCAANTAAALEKPVMGVVMI